MTAMVAFARNTNSHQRLQWGRKWTACSSLKKLIPLPTPPAYCVPSPLSRGPDAGSGGEAGDGAPVWLGRKSATGLATIVPLESGPSEEAPDRDGRPLVRSMSTVLGPRPPSPVPSRGALALPRALLRPDPGALATSKTAFRRRSCSNRFFSSFAEDAQLHLCIYLPVRGPCPMFIVAGR